MSVGCVQTMTGRFVEGHSVDRCFVNERFVERMFHQEPFGRQMFRRNDVWPQWDSVAAGESPVS